MGILNWLKGGSKGEPARPAGGSTSSGAQPASGGVSSGAVDASNEGTPPGRIIDDFTPLHDAYVAAQGAGPASHDYFRKFLSLPTLHALPSPPPAGTVESSMESGQPINPLCMRENGLLHVVLFTSAARAHACAVENGLAAGGGAFATLEMATPAALSMMMRSGVIEAVMINLNRGDHAITTPVSGLAATYEYLFDRVAPDGLLAFLRNESARPSKWGQARVARRLLLDGTPLFMSGTPDRPSAPAVHAVSEKRALLCVYTGEAELVTGAAMSSPDAPSASVIPTTPRDLVVYAEKLASHSGGVISETVINLGTTSTVIGTDAWRAALNELEKPGVL